MSKIKFLLLILIVLPTFSFSQSTKPTRNPISGWIGYEQQLGAYNGEFITFGGGTAAISFFGLSFGVAAYGNYNTGEYKYGAEPFVLYGGVTLGYKSKIYGTTGFRLNTLLGYGTIDEGSFKTGHFVVSPTLLIDVHMFAGITFSIGLNYRYFHEANHSSFGLDKLENSFSGVVALSWMGK